MNEFFKIRFNHIIDTFFSKTVYIKYYALFCQIEIPYRWSLSLFSLCSVNLCHFLTLSMSNVGLFGNTRNQK
jgi:hypothetical protein